jgi:uncharacterized protein
LRSRFVLALLVIQSIFCLLHFFLYKTVVELVWEPSYGPLRLLRIAFVILSFVFVAASVLAFFANNLILRVFYTLAALWTGLGSFLFWAAVASWFVALTETFTNLPLHARGVAQLLFAIATLAAIAAALNAQFPRMRRYTVKLPNLPEAWRGRTAALVSDLHLGHVHHLGFSRRIVQMVDRANPDLVLIAGDFYDGTKVDLELMVSPWRRLKPQVGIYFSTGNHEEFRKTEAYLDALRSVGIRVLNGEKVVADGLQIAGVHHHETVHADTFRAALAKAEIDRNAPSILISHSPHRLNIPEQAGISLQVSGHTHGGQFWPYNWLTNRIFGEYVHGLHKFGEMQVITSYGAGTWGPPMRLGTTPEIILIEFE